MPMFQSDVSPPADSLVSGLRGSYRDSKQLEISSLLISSLVQADLSTILKFSNPKTVLFKTLRKYSLGSAQLKLLKESGRQSHAPIFIVGAFDGE